MKKISILLLVVTIVFACDRVTPTKHTTSNDSANLVGSDKDGYGCVGSAGYRWSELRQDCIRIWEEGISLLPITESTVSAYAIFNSDSSKVELFLPDGSKPKILDKRKLSDGGTVWNVEDDDTLNLRMISGKWQISQRGKVIYLQK